MESDSVSPCFSFYEILGPLGAGAMGEVLRARDTRPEREVAIKVLPKQFAEDDERQRPLRVPDRQARVRGRVDDRRLGGHRRKELARLAGIHGS